MRAPAAGYLPPEPPNNPLEETRPAYRFLKIHHSSAQAGLLSKNVSWAREFRMATRTLKETAVDFLTRVVAGDVRGAYERHVANGFRHHNPYFAGDTDSLRRGMEEDEARNPGKRLDVQLALQDGNYVAVHSRLQRSAGQPDIAVVHIFRFEQERIAELWDIAQVAPKQIVNLNGMF